MAENEEKFVDELPARRIAYDYDKPSSPFTPDQIAYIIVVYNRRPVALSPKWSRKNRRSRSQSRVSRLTAR